MKTILLLMLMFVSIICISQPVTTMNVRANLYVTNEDGLGAGDHLYGGVLTQYFTNYCNCVDVNDALKLGGGYATEIAIFRNPKYLSVERRDTVFTTDTTFLLINNHRNINMMLELSVANVYPFNLGVQLLDAVTNTTTNIPINGSIFKYYFTGVPNPVGYGDNRFRIVLTNPPGFVAPPIFTEFKAYPNPVNSGGILNVELPQSETKTFYLLSINGIKYSVDVVNDKIKIPIVPSGIYLLYNPINGLRKKVFIR